MKDMEEEELRIYYGDEIWKTGLEFYNEYMVFRGKPYYRITKTDDTYYLWKLDYADPNALQYKILKTNDDFMPLYEEGMALQDALREELFPTPDWMREHEEQEKKENTS